MTATRPGQKIGEGRTAEIYQWGPDKVLKLYRDWVPPEVCDHELEKTRLAFALTGLAPRAYEAAEWKGRQGGIYQRIPGQTMIRCGSLPRMGRSLADCHVRIQKPVLSPFPTVHEKLRRQIGRADCLDPEERADVLHRLDRLPQGDILCHLDFHPDNVMLTGEGPVVLDWDGCARGNPLADGARTCLLLEFGELPSAPLPLRALLWLARSKALRDYRREFLRLTGASRREMERWLPPLLAARLAELEPGRERERVLRALRRRLAGERPSP